jgi:hypothetical protein
LNNLSANQQANRSNKLIAKRMPVQTSFLQHQHKKIMGMELQNAEELWL